MDKIKSRKKTSRFINETCFVATKFWNCTKWKWTKENLEKRLKTHQWKMRTICNNFESHITFIKNSK